MAENADIVDRVDALMRSESAAFGGRRRRRFIADATDKADSASAPPEANEDEDIPVLTEVVFAEAAVPEPPPDHIDEALLAIVASDLVHSLEQQLSIELPTLIEATLLNAQNELRSGISSTLEMALRDFLARRQQLSLPFEEPDRGD